MAGGQSTPPDGSSPDRPTTSRSTAPSTYRTSSLRIPRCDRAQQCSGSASLSTAPSIFARSKLRPRCWRGQATCRSSSSPSPRATRSATPVGKIGYLRPKEFPLGLPSTLANDGDGTGDELQLVVVEQDNVTVHNLPAHGQVLVGRATEADVTLADPGASAQHA